MVVRPDRERAVPPEARLAPLRLTWPGPSTAVIVPPPHVPLRPPGRNRHPRRQRVGEPDPVERGVVRVGHVKAEAGRLADRDRRRRERDAQGRRERDDDRRRGRRAVSASVEAYVGGRGALRPDGRSEHVDEHRALRARRDRRARHRQRRRAGDRGHRAGRAASPRLLGVAIFRPAGSVSVTPTPCSALGLAAGLVIVSVAVVVEFRAMVGAA